MKDRISSKAWDWANVPSDEWVDISEEFIPTALRWKREKKERIMDLGCGRGRHTLYLAEMGFSVTAVDLSQDAIVDLQKEVEQRRYKRKVKTVVCDMTDLHFQVRSFDCILAFHSLYHTDYKGLTKAVTDIEEILKDEGEFYVTFNSKESPSFKETKNKRIDEYTIVKTRGFEQGIPHTFLNYKDILKLLHRFEIRKIQHIRDHYQDRISCHYFVEAIKKNRKRTNRGMKRDITSR
jgi:cyclopropane fatty-acyl-phospholipid synthase-like methyltransferase